MIRCFDEHGLRIDRVLTDRGTAYCGARDRDYQELYVAVEDIDHTRTRTKSPQTNGICERFHKALLDEFCRVAFCRNVHRAIEDLQADIHEWMRHHDAARTHHGRWCFGKTAMQAFLNSRLVAHEKQNIGKAAGDAAPDSFDAAGTRHAGTMTVRSSPNFDA